MVGRNIGGDLELGTGHRWTPALDSSYADAVVRGTWAAATAETVLPTAAARMIGRNLLNAVMLGLPHSHSHLLATEPRSPSASRAVQARIWLEGHYDESVRVGDLADALGLSLRQIQALLALVGSHAACHRPDSDLRL